MNDEGAKKVSELLKANSTITDISIRSIYEGDNNPATG